MRSGAPTAHARPRPSAAVAAALTLVLVLVLALALPGCTQAPAATPAAAAARAVPPAPFDPPLPATLRRTAGASERVLLHDCPELLGLAERLAGSDSDVLWRVLRARLAECQVQALLPRLRPARQSALPGPITAGAPALDPARLPASLWAAPSPDEQATLAQPGRSLADAVADDARVGWASGRADGVLELSAEGMRIRLTARGRGDLDGDGWEELVFTWEAAAVPGSYTDARAVVLARRQDQPRWRELDVAALLRAR